MTLRHFTLHLYLVPFPVLCRRLVYVGATAAGSRTEELVRVDGMTGYRMSVFFLRFLYAAALFCRWR